MTTLPEDLHAFLQARRALLGRKSMGAKLRRGKMQVFLHPTHYFFQSYVDEIIKQNTAHKREVPHHARTIFHNFLQHSDSGFQSSLCEQVLPIVAIRLGEIKDLPTYPHAYVGRNSSVGIATRYGLDGQGTEPRWGARHSAPIQTGPGGRPASYRVSTGSFPGVERPGRGVDHPFTSSAEVKERVQLYIYSPSGPPWPVIE